jgi:hypothetical protein
MARYFFSVRMGDTLYEDKEGQELVDHAAMVAAALFDAKILLRDGPDRPDVLAQSIIVTDEQHKTVHLVHLANVTSQLGSA